jgi:hypothetical protein
MFLSYLLSAVKQLFVAVSAILNAAIFYHLCLCLSAGVRLLDMEIHINFLSKRTLIPAVPKYYTIYYNYMCIILTN